MSSSTTHKPSMLGTDLIYTDNPFILEDISGKQNKILDSVRNKTNCLIFRGESPSIRVVQSDTPQFLNINGKDIEDLPTIPEFIKVLIARDNLMKSVSRISNHPSLEIIDISNNVFGHFALPPIPRLSAFFCASSGITAFQADCLFQNLQILNLCANKLADIDISNFPSIRVLNLSLNSFNNFTVNSRSLQELSLQGNSLALFSVESAPSLANVDLSNNRLVDLTFIDKLPSLSRFSGNGNKFGRHWESFVVTAAKKLSSINGRAITDSERAIHRDRVAKLVKATKSEHPHSLISEIRKQFARLKAITVFPAKTTEIVDLWICRSSEKAERLKLLENECSLMKSYYNIDEKQCLLVYGALLSDEPSKMPFKKAELNYCPILRGGLVERNVALLSNQRPVSLKLSFNFLNSLLDLLFLRVFDSVQILKIDGNAVTNMSLFRPFVACLMKSLIVLNGVAVSDEEIAAGKTYFSNLLMSSHGIEAQSREPSNIAM